MHDSNGFGFENGHGAVSDIRRTSLFAGHLRRTYGIGIGRYVEDVGIAKESGRQTITVDERFYGANRRGQRSYHRQIRRSIIR